MWDGWTKPKFAFPAFWPLGVDSREENTTKKKKEKEKPESYTHIIALEGHEQKSP